MTQLDLFDDLNKKILQCEGCPTSSKHIPELGWGTPEKILFVGQCPAFSNIHGVRGTSKFDKFFLELLKPVGLTSNDFFFTNLVKVPAKMSLLSEEALDHCASHVKDEIALIRPKFIFTLGKFSYQSLKKKGVRVYGMTHPGAIHHGAISIEQWQEGLKNLLIKTNAIERIQ